MTSRLLPPQTLHSGSDIITLLKKCQSFTNRNALNEIENNLNEIEKTLKGKP